MDGVGCGMGDATSPKELAEVERCADRRIGRRYAETYREGRGERAMSNTEIAAMLIASFRSDCAVASLREARSWVAPG
jgi:hypothetical protein